MTHYGIWVLLRTNRLALFKAWEPKAKTAEKQWNWNLVKPNLSLLWHSTVPNLLNGTGSWFQQLYLMASLRMSRRSGQSELKRCVYLTDRIANFVTWTVANCWINWHLTVAKCAVPSGLSQRLCLNKRAVKICVAKSAECIDSWFHQLYLMASLRNVQKIWPERTETLCSSHWSNYKFCDLDGSKWLNQLTLDCGKVRQVRRAKWPIPASLSQQKSCQNLCCWLFPIGEKGILLCLSDTAFAHYTLTGDLSSSTM